jgi:hypothetical protein
MGRAVIASPGSVLILPLHLTPSIILKCFVRRLTGSLLMYISIVESALINVNWFISIFTHR